MHAWGLYLVVGDVSGASGGVIFLGIMQSMAHKIQINLSVARPHIKTDSQPLYL